jgi:phosphatidate cytidylyltransferase
MLEPTSPAAPQRGPVGPRPGTSVSNFASRVLVGIVGLPVVLGLVWLGGWWLYGLVTVAGLVAVHEFVTMARPLRPLAPAAYAGVVLALVGARIGGLVWMLAGFLATFVLGFLLDALAKTRAPSTAAIGSTVLGSAWIGLGLGHLLLLRQLHQEPRLIAFTVLLTVWTTDTFAYVTGRLIGRHKLAPRLSPAKTWEGLVGGSLAGIFVSFVALYDARSHYLAIWQAVVLGVVVVVAAVAGDLFESALKRDMEVKDTGRLLGGHGGVLDRADALLFAGAAAYYLVLAFGH